MYENELMDLEVISRTVGNSADYVQGGGGNTSVKLDDELMSVKASGYRLKQITSKGGYVVVNYKNIRTYYQNVDLKEEKDFEKESADFVRANIVAMDGHKMLRPSVEAGFHSILKKYVIHTHPVYANILCCSEKGRELAEKIFTGSDYTFLWVPYFNPGFCLTLKIQDCIRETLKKDGRFPEVIFMENHGLIVSSDDRQRCIDLHREVNSLIREYLNIKDAYPQIQLKQIDDNTFLSKTQYIADYLKNNKIGYGFFDNVLYPDQLVYLNGNICIDGMSNKMNIDASTGDIMYKTNYQEALTIEETLLAFLYVTNNIINCGLKLKTMSQNEIDFIKNWESEAYRKSLARNFAK